MRCVHCLESGADKPYGLCHTCYFTKEIVREYRRAAREAAQKASADATGSIIAGTSATTAASTAVSTDDGKSGQGPPITPDDFLGRTTSSCRIDPATDPPADPCLELSCNGLADDRPDSRGVQMVKSDAAITAAPTFGGRYFFMDHVKMDVAHEGNMVEFFSFATIDKAALTDSETEQFAEQIALKIINLPSEERLPYLYRLKASNRSLCRLVIGKLKTVRDFYRKRPFDIKNVHEVCRIWRSSPQVAAALASRPSSGLPEGQAG